MTEHRSPFNPKIVQRKSEERVLLPSERRSIAQPESSEKAFRDFAVHERERLLALAAKSKDSGRAWTRAVVLVAATSVVIGGFEILRRPKRDDFSREGDKPIPSSPPHDVPSTGAPTIEESKVEPSEEQVTGPIPEQKVEDVPKEQTQEERQEAWNKLSEEEKEKAWGEVEQRWREEHEKSRKESLVRLKNEIGETRQIEKEMERCNRFVELLSRFPNTDLSFQDYQEFFPEIAAVKYENVRGEAFQAYFRRQLERSRTPQDFSSFLQEVSSAEANGYTFWFDDIRYSVDPGPQGFVPFKEQWEKEKWDFLCRLAVERIRTAKDCEKLRNLLEFKFPKGYIPPVRIPTPDEYAQK